MTTWPDTPLITMKLQLLFLVLQRLSMEVFFWLVAMSAEQENRSSAKFNTSVSAICRYKWYIKAELIFFWYAIVAIVFSTS